MTKGAKATETVEMDYRTKAGSCVKMALIGADVTALHEAAQCIRGGAYRLWHDDRLDLWTLWGDTPTGHRFETSEPLLITYGEDDRILAIEGKIAVF